MHSLSLSFASLAATQEVYIPSIPISTDAGQHKLNHKCLGSLKEGDQPTHDYPSSRGRGTRPWSQVSKAISPIVGMSHEYCSSAEGVLEKRECDIYWASVG